MLDINAYENIYNRIDFLFLGNLDITSFSSWRYFFLVQLEFLARLSSLFEHDAIYLDQSIGIISLLHWGMMIFINEILFYLYIRFFFRNEYAHVLTLIKISLEDTTKFWFHVCLFSPF
jgi:hypothetical protein